MRKAFTLVISLGLVFYIWYEVPKKNEEQLDKQEKELAKSFELIKVHTEVKKAELQKVEKRIADVYTPTLVGENGQFNHYGIGGFNYVSVVRSGKYVNLVHTTFKDVKNTEATANYIDYKLRELETHLPRYQDSLKHTPSIRPIPYDSLTAIGSTFGMRYHPILHKLRMHKGVDLAAPKGTPIYATADGIVVKSEYDKSFGNFVKIKHGYGYVTKYGHMSRILVKEGDRVKKGQVIGLVGNTGLSVHSHLHYEVWVNGQPRNPFYYYLDNLTIEEYASLTRKSKKSESFFVTK